MIFTVLERRKTLPKKKLLKPSIKHLLSRDNFKDCVPEVESSLELLSPIVTYKLALTIWTIASTSLEYKIQHLSK
jgi:hypothetical protein